jgi:hypothetical protein
LQDRLICQGLKASVLHAREAKLKIPRRHRPDRESSRFAKPHDIRYQNSENNSEKYQNAEDCSQAPQHKLIKMAANNAAPSGATDAVLKPSDPVPEGAMPVKGLDFNDFKDRNITAAELVENMAQMGFQASSIGQAAKIVDGMVCTDVFCHSRNLR